MQKGFIFTIVAAGGLIFSIANDGFSRERYDRDRRVYEYEYEEEYDDDAEYTKMPRTHSREHSPQTHGLTGAEGAYGRGGSGVNGYIVGGTVGSERERVFRRIDKSSVNEVISNWNDTSRGVAQKMIDKYGMPDEVTHNRLIWHDNGPWKKTEVVNEEISHSFPEDHEDVLIQTVNYDVPPDKVDDLIKYNESIIIEKNRGELGSQCGSEEMNILALNLADDIVKGESDVREARNTFEQEAADVMEGKKTSLTRSLQFKTNSGSQRKR